MGSKSLALLVAVIGVVALAAAGVYLYRHHGAAPRIEDKVAKGEKPAPEQPKPLKSQPAKSAPSKPTAVPSFDIVRIEPTGEGVVAGRAEPGWTVTLESSGNKIAETKADEEGAWSVVLDKPLASGDHTLALRATSPDGTQALTAEQPVQVAVGNAEAGARSHQQSAAAEPKPEETPQAKSEAPAKAAPPEAPKSEQQEQAEELKGVEGQPEPVVPDENAPRERPKPPVRIGNLEYQDTGQDRGKISIFGVGDPNIRVFLFFDDHPLSQVTIGSDGTWAIEIEKKLGEGEHTIRADTYDEKTGMVAGRASVRLGREPEAAKPETAKQEAATPQPEAAKAPEAAPAEPATAQAGCPLNLSRFTRKKRLSRRATRRNRRRHSLSRPSLKQPRPSLPRPSPPSSPALPLLPKRRSERLCSRASTTATRARRPERWHSPGQATLARTSSSSSTRCRSAR
jgi:Bacterial Ig domain